MRKGKAVGQGEGVGPGGAEGLAVGADAEEQKGQEGQRDDAGRPHRRRGVYLLTGMA